MSIDAHFIQKTIAKVEELQQKKGRTITTIEELRILLNEEAYQRENPTHLLNKTNQKVDDLENEIAKQIILLNRFSKQLIKKGLGDFDSLTSDDFTYLYRLMDYDSLSKMKLVEKNGHEKQTGIEIIRRLIKNGLMEEFPDEEDRRIKRVKVTQLGKDIFIDSIQHVTVISRILSANITRSRKEELLATLKELNEFHFMVYSEYKNADIHTINDLI